MFGCVKCIQSSKGVDEAFLGKLEVLMWFVGVSAVTLETLDGIETVHPEVPQEVPESTWMATNEEL